MITYSYILDVKYTEAFCYLFSFCKRAYVIRLSYMVEEREREERKERWRRERERERERD